MEILIKAGQLILSLSILVLFHELGHFAFAKLFKTRVEKFYLFFNPWFSLFKIKRGDTEYGIGWLPLGGYVKISGMIDESMDKEQLDKEPEPWEFRSKPAIQRLLIMLGGVLVNFLLAIFIYIFILFYWGDEYLPTENVKYGIMTDSIGESIGLKNGDKIISVNNKDVTNFRKIIPEILLSDNKTIQIDRNGTKKELLVSDSMVAKIIKHRYPFIEVRIPFIVNGFTKNSVAEKAGLKKGDKIIALNGKEIHFFDEFKYRLPDYINKEIVITVDRNGKELDIAIVVPKEGLIGVAPLGKLDEFFELRKVNYSFFQAIPAGISKGYNEVGDYLRQFRLLFTPETEAYKNIGGFIAIGNIFPSTWNWYAFWTMTALLSIMLGVINILPIPALDGGHAMFLFYEIISGRKPSDKFMEYAQITGMVILLSLVLYANGNDILTYIIK